MKTLAKFLSLSLLVLFASCSKDEEAPNVNQGDAVGIWQLTDVSCTDGTTTTTGPGFPTINGTFTVSGKNYNTTVEFKADGTYKSQGSYTSVVTTTVQGFSQPQEVDSGLFEGTGTWSITGNALTANDGTNTSTTTIEELTSTKMVLVLKADVTQTPGQGFVSNSKGTYRFTLTK